MMPAATMAADILLGLELAEIPKDRSEQRDGGFTKQGAAVALVTRRAAQKNRFMKWFEGSLFVLLALMFWVHLFFIVPGISFLSILFYQLLSLTYFLLGVIIFNRIRLRKMFDAKSYEGEGVLRILGGIGVGLLLSFMMFALTFKIMHWTGAHFMLIIATVPLLIVSIACVALYRKDDTPFCRIVLSRTLYLCAVAMMMHFVSPMFFTEIKFREYPELVDAYRNYYDNPEDERGEAAAGFG